MAYQSPQSGGRFHIFTSQPSTLSNSIITNSSLASTAAPPDTASPIASNSGLTVTQGSPESYASFDGRGSASCSTTPSADLGAANILGDVDASADMAWIHGISAGGLYGDHSGDYAVNVDAGGPSRRFSLSCASDAETIVTANQAKAGTGMAWYGQCSNPGPAYLQQALQAPQAPQAPPDPQAPFHARKRTHDTIDVPDTYQQNKRSCSSLGQDVDHLLHSLGQDPADVEAQLSQGQRPPVFDQICRAQLAHASPGSPSEDPMMPPMPMHAMEHVSSVPGLPTSQSAPLLNYHFPQTMPSINDPQHNSGSVSALFAMHTASDPAVLDLSDPAMLDRVLGLAQENPTFGW